MDNLAFFAMALAKTAYYTINSASDRPFGSFRFETSIITGDNAQ
ncbi:hypothetical protein ABXR98_18755 [Snodgrassella alvi]